MVAVPFLDTIYGEMMVKMVTTLDSTLLTMYSLWYISISMSLRIESTGTSIERETLMDGVTSQLQATYLLLIFLISQ